MKKIPRSFYVWIATGCIAIFAALSLFGDQGFIAVYKAHTETQVLSDRIAESKRAIDSLQLEIERLKNDTVYIEKIAREKLGMARRNEKIFKFIEEK